MTPAGAHLAVGPFRVVRTNPQRIRKRVRLEDKHTSYSFRTEGEVPLTLRASHRPARPTPAPIFSVECRSRGALCQERGKNNLVFPQNSTQW